MTMTMNIRMKQVAAAALISFGAIGAAQAQKAEVIHWWTSGGEAAAIKEFATMYTKAGGTWVDTPIAGGGGAQARTVMANRTMGGDAPTAAQYNYGKQYEEIIKEGLLNDLDDVAKKGNWDKLLPEKIRNAVKVNGKYFAVPVNLHNENWVWFNKAVLAKAGAKEPTNMDEMFAAMDKVKAAGGVVPLALGGQGWQEGITFRGVLLATGGQDLYLKTFKDKDASTPGFRKAVETFKKLKGYVDPGSPGRDWNLATGMVIEGKAAFQMMGDWAKGEFVNAGKTAGKEYGCFMAGGPKMPYAIGGDVFVFPKQKSADSAAAQKKLAEMMISPEGQVAFNNKKGSIPIRTDVDTSKMDICAQAGVQAIKENRLLQSDNELLSPDAKGAFEDAVSKYWNSSQSADDAIKSMAVALKR
ncbi:ABC transporter substrate-binding protein [Sphaerotilus montanus]|uniref:Probable sugar-binding periplasmic protein n=1 Tax=Sphaerotilus montanus TaxID=522889 RepID=A0A7Y9QX46_9BURK|nr:ABC transporter substrate-binding protein [Sphaerotilus montanus]NYG31403.1 glucose/mannose transport system substrate-binding protein [Sphaerotilus montanus]